MFTNFSSAVTTRGENRPGRPTGVYGLAYIGL
ncbi:hypothetical protein A2U01_0094345, partial [Trifolium medium]|nr:hypothetical protein [Trifolium medium]